MRITNEQVFTEICKLRRDIELNSIKYNLLEFENKSLKEVFQDIQENNRKIRDKIIKKNKK
jgi:hypothetical protein